MQKVSPLSMRKYTVITPVYNRPDELAELLESLANQSFPPFEVIIVEDGSVQKAEEVCRLFQDRLTIHYFFKENSGQGFSRNYAFERASGDYFIQFDSDAVIPRDYFEKVDKALDMYKWDAFGGPDAADATFTPVQKAINYAMTSVFTTGGIRGKKNNLGGQFHPRSFNFGISRQVWETVGGYKVTRMGEDIEYSIRIINSGFRVGLIEEAFVYHKRRTSFQQFFRQLHFFGRARINIARFYPKELKLVHLFPSFFFLAASSIPFWFLVFPPFGWLGLCIYLIYFVTVGIDAYRQNQSIHIAFLSLWACAIQLNAYGIGFISEGITYLTEPKSKN